MQSGYSDLQRFLRSFALVVLLIAAGDFILGRAMHYLYDRQQSGLLYRTTYSIDSTRADYVALGSSRCNHHYDPQVFESVLKKPFYNCGRDDQGALYSCGVISAILNRYDPKGVIIDIRPDEFSHSDEGTLSTLLPYYRNSAIRPYLNYNGQFQSIKLLSGTYPYNSLLTNLVVGLKRGHDEDDQGYIALHKTNPYPHMKTITEKGPPDSVKIKAFYELIGKLQRRHIPTLLVISPAYAHHSNNITTGVCAEAARMFPTARFLNFLNRPEWQNNKDFSDDNHLNSAGAVLFSEVIAKELATTASSLAGDIKLRHSE